MRNYFVLVILILLIISCDDKDTGSIDKAEDKSQNDEKETVVLLPYHQKIHKVEVDFPFKPKYKHINGGDSLATKSTFIIDTDTMKLGLTESTIPGAGILINDSLISAHHQRIKQDIQSKYLVTNWLVDEHKALDSTSAYSKLSGYTSKNQFVSMAYYRSRNYIAQFMTWSDSSNAKLVQTSSESFNILTD